MSQPQPAKAARRPFSFRRLIFWGHLILGIVTGVVVFIMSATGIAIAFEEEMLAWADREVSHVSPPAEAAARLPVEALVERVTAAHPDFVPTSITVFSEPDHAHAFYAGREGPLYVNPYTGETRESEAHDLHHFIHYMEEWHRWLAMEGDAFPVGRMITGVANIGFLLLCISGLYLWLPRRWSWRALRPILWFVKGYKGKARDYNWHNVLGFWSLPVLVVLAATAVVISFRWGHNLPFQLAGETPPEARNYGMMRTPPAEVPTPPEGAQRVPLDVALTEVSNAYPEWVNIGLELPTPEQLAAETPDPLHLGVTVPDYMPSRAYIPIESDPFTGTILKTTHFETRSPGLQARVWIRFLHTGGAFGFWGKLIASIACLASLVLVYTGFALTWRRWLRSQKKKAKTA
ncbi:MAG: PepSY-associated TM helix domain-containing protein [Verrucomicrobiota bacterium JB022]|nr:PepSY-associated TM helix domain-containing protein [Verrucomicrobiota bacterium JB022]